MKKKLELRGTDPLATRQMRTRSDVLRSLVVDHLREKDVVTPYDCTDL